MTQYRVENILLATILIVYLILAGLYAVRTPDWQTPDEPAHYNYIAQIAKTGTTPIIERGDWDQAYLQQLLNQRFAPEYLDKLDSVQYEDHQPPLYYLLATPIYLLSDGDLTTLRLFSAMFGLMIILAAYSTGSILFPQQPWLSLSGTAFVAFLPQHLHILASVNNDALGWAVVACTLAAIMAYLKDIPYQEHSVQPWHLGVLVGIGLLTKSTTYFMVGIVILAIVLKWLSAHLQAVHQSAENTFPEETRRDTYSLPLGVLLRRWLGFLLPALVLGSLWWLRNFDSYGFPDFLGLAAHDFVVVGQPRTADRIDLLGFSGYLRELMQTTFNSFWGQFGWMGVPMQPCIYTAIGLLGTVILSGLGINRNSPQTITSAQRNCWLILLSTILFSTLAFLYYNTEFQQYQGRYLFPMLIPLGVLFALGMDAWRRLISNILAKYIPVNHEHLLVHSPWLLLIPFMLVPLFDVWLLWRVIVPNLQ